MGEVVWLLKDAKSPVLQLGFILSRYRVTSGDNEIPMYIIQPLGTHFIEEKVEHIQQKSMKPFLSLTVPGMANKNLSIVPFNQVDWQSLAQQAKSQGTRETRQLTTEASKLAARTVDCSFSVFRIARQNPRTSELVPAIANDVDGAFLGAERIVRGDVVRINSMRVAMAANGALGQALSITRDSIRIMHVQRLSLTSDYGTPEKPSVAGTLVFVGTIFAPRRYPSAAEAAAAQAQYRDVLPAVLLDDLRDANAGGTISVPNGAAPGTMAAAAHPGATHWIWVPTIQTASLTADLIAGRYYGGANLSRIVSASTLSTTRERNFAMAATAAAAEAGGPAASQQQQQAYPAPVAEHSFLNSFWGRNSIQGYFRGEVPSRLDAFRDMVPAHTTLEFRWPDIAAAVAQGAMDPPEGLPVVLPPQQQQQQQQAKVGWKPPPFPPPAVVAEPRWEEAPLLLQEGRLPGDLPPQQG